MNCMWIKDEDDERKSNNTSSRTTRTNLYMTRRLGRGSLTLLHNILNTFWGMLSSSSLMRRLHPSGRTFDFYDSWSTVGIMTNKHSKSISIFGIIPHKRICSSSPSCLGQGRIVLASLSYLLVLEERPSWYMFRDTSSLILLTLQTSRLLVVSYIYLHLVERSLGVYPFWSWNWHTLTLMGSALDSLWCIT